MKEIKLLGIIMVVVILCLVIGNAVTGHGIKGNSNLNVVVIANETGTGTGSGTDLVGPRKYVYVKENIKYPNGYADTTGTSICTYSNLKIYDKTCYSGMELPTCTNLKNVKYYEVECVPKNQ